MVPLCAAFTQCLALPVPSRFSTRKINDSKARLRLGDVHRALVNGFEASALVQLLHSLSVLY
jgi:hypothetical protein